MKTLILVLALTISLLSACSKSSQIDKIIDSAEAVIMEHPDSALEMLDKIERVELAEGKQREWLKKTATPFFLYKLS